jgi:hypothetical protein
MKRPAFWTRIVEEMHRARFYGTTYRFRHMMLTEDPISRARADMVARYAYRRIESRSAPGTEE